MNKHYKIDERHTEFGIFELWEHSVYADTVPCLVTLNGEIITRTYDTLDIEIDNYREA